MMKKTIFFLNATILLFGSCDQITNPIPEGGEIDPGDTSTVYRKVLLEDFTGHLCNNCPGASIIAESLVENLYGDQLIVVGIHAPDGYFTQPANPPNPDGSYSTDFRTTSGNTYGQDFGISAQPQGMVSRREYNSSLILSPGAWGSAVADIIGEEAIIKLEFDDVQYNEANDQVSSQITVEALEELTGEYKLVVYLIEDHIIDWQTDTDANPPDVPDYDHRHVLRDNLNGTWGETVFAGTVAAGESFIWNSGNFILDPDWNMDNGYLVAYVYDDATSEIFQVEQIEVNP